MPPPAVLHVTDHLGAGGAETVFAQLVAALAAERLTRNVVCIATARRAEPRLLAAARGAAEELAILERRHVYDPAITAAMVRLIRRHEVDVVHSHPGTLHPHARLAAFALRRPHVTTLHTAPGPAVEDSRVLLAADRLTGFASRAIVAPSQAIADAYAAAHYRGAARRLRVIPNPAPHRQAPELQAIAAAREQLGGERLILCVARLQPAKGIADLLEAVALLESPARVWVAGQGPERAALQARIAALGLEGRAQLLGHREDVGVLLGAADVFCLPSHHEGVPLSVLEAMAAGVPCVATRVGGVPELIEDGRSGVLVEPHSPAALAGALARVLEDGSLAATLREGGAAVAARRSPEAYAGSYAELYAELLRGS